ncbi:MAG TPA: S24/S26 family peptidase [Anaerolineae bacterium]|nr:S24/S26 family peptidase [Anaerolineae bacterium]
MNPSPTPQLNIHAGEIVQLSGAELVGLMQAVLETGAQFRFRARGMSMMPFIHDQDVVTVAPLTHRAEVGDVIAFVHPQNQKPILHRVVERDAHGYWTQGDNSAAPDGWIPATAAVGVIVAVEREGRAVRFGLGPERRLIAAFSPHRRLWRRLNALLHRWR